MDLIRLGAIKQTLNLVVKHSTSCPLFQTKFETEKNYYPYTKRKNQKPKCPSSPITSSSRTSRWAAQIAHQGQLAHHVGKRQAALPVTPGNIPGLVPGSPAAAQW